MHGGVGGLHVGSPSPWQGDLQCRCAVLQVWLSVMLRCWFIEQTGCCGCGWSKASTHHTSWPAAPRTGIPFSTVHTNLTCNVKIAHSAIVNTFSRTGASSLGPGYFTSYIHSLYHKRSTYFTGSQLHPLGPDQALTGSGAPAADLFYKQQIL